MHLRLEKERRGFLGTICSCIPNEPSERLRPKWRGRRCFASSEEISAVALCLKSSTEEVHAECPIFYIIAALLC